MSHPLTSNRKLEAVILAGGLSSRMGRNKALISFGGQTSLRRTALACKTVDLEIRVIRKDLIPRCGPLGGFYTALMQSSAERILILPCDMPLLSSNLLLVFLEFSRLPGPDLIATTSERGPGFPYLVPREQLPSIKSSIDERQWSVQKWFANQPNRLFTPPKEMIRQLSNFNTPSDLETFAGSS